MKRVNKFAKKSRSSKKIEEWESDKYESYKDSSESEDEIKRHKKIIKQEKKSSLIKLNVNLK